MVWLVSRGLGCVLSAIQDGVPLSDYGVPWERCSTRDAGGSIVAGQRRSRMQQQVVERYSRT
jgi:hypothetical protein